jgi:hypothetical protein
VEIRNEWRSELDAVEECAEQQRNRAKEAEQRIAEYKASEAVWLESARALNIQIEELTMDRDASKYRAVWERDRVKSVEAELEKTREKLRTALNWDAARKAAYVQFANAIRAISKQQVPHPLRGAISGAIEALDATLIGYKDAINLSQPIGHAPNECPECEGTGNVIGKSGCSACGGSGSAAPKHTCRPDDLSAYCEACQSEEDAEMRAHEPCLCRRDPCICDVLTYGNAPSVLGVAWPPKVGERIRMLPQDAPADKPDAPNIQQVRDCLNQAIGEPHGPDVDALIDAVLELTRIVERLSTQMAYTNTCVSMSTGISPIECYPVVL